MLPYRSMMIVLTTLACGWLIHSSTASVIRSYSSYLDHIPEQDSSFDDIQFSYPDEAAEQLYNRNQRNGGTADVLYNIPDLGDIGK
uniref:Cerebrin 1 n=1 Tax=Deroceras reticulatum TaxID=145610 RepID=A0A1X9WEC8_DERRE|nr:cerebrin 1 [Deroceras reticulatum]